jgi:hypothetical protein
MLSVKRFPLLVVFILACFLPGTSTANEQSQGTEEQIGFKVLGIAGSINTEKELVVLSSRRKLVRLVHKLFPGVSDEQIPTVDFAQKKVVALVLGLQPVYRDFSVESVTRDGEALRIYLNDKRPGDCAVSALLWNPVILVEVNIGKGSITEKAELVESSDITDCRILETYISKDVASVRAPYVPFEVKGATISGDTLNLIVSYIGECGPPHGFLLFASLNSENSQPAEAEIQLSNYNNGYPCTTNATRTILFDLTPLKKQYQQQYGGQSGTIDIKIRTSSKTIRYDF